MKCKFCLFSKENPEEVLKHQKNCPFNPEKHSCCTCNSFYVLHEGINCRKKVEGVEKIFELNLPCEHWNSI